MPASTIRATSAHRVRRNPLLDLSLAGRVSTDTALMLASGGDSRIAANPLSGLNRYGTRTSPAPGEVSFASTTANCVSAAAFDAASAALDQLLTASLADRLQIDAWFDGIRDRIARHFCTPGSAVVLAASGTDAELIAIGLAAGLTPRPITNILIAPDETGSGVPMAAAGRHFLGSTALGAAVQAGTPIDATLAGRTHVRSIAIRAADGTPRPPEMVDRDAELAVAEELGRSHDVLLHVLDTSKTGLYGVSRRTARKIAKAAPGRVRVLVDACQLRCSFAALRQDLDDGFMVVATGSKFAGGPPFSGALLLPPQLVDEAGRHGSLTPGFDRYSAAFDWPMALRPRFAADLTTDANIGLGLRWVAALEAIDRIARVPAPMQQAIVDRFAVAVRDRARRLPSIAFRAAEHPAGSSILALDILDRSGQPARFDDVQALHAALRGDEAGQVCHIGQPVRLGARTVLRLALSANDIAAVAERLTHASMDDAVRPLEVDLDTVFQKWQRLAGG